jgi:hypothetical protein
MIRKSAQNDFYPPFVFRVRELLVLRNWVFGKQAEQGRPSESLEAEREGENQKTGA